MISGLKAMEYVRNILRNRRNDLIWERFLFYIKASRAEKEEK